MRVRRVETQPVRTEPPALDPRWRAREARRYVQAMQERIFIEDVLVLLDPIHDVDEQPGVAVARIIRAKGVHGERLPIKPRRRLEAQQNEGQPPARRAASTPEQEYSSGTAGARRLGVQTKDLREVQQLVEAVLLRNQG